MLEGESSSGPLQQEEEGLGQPGPDWPDCVTVSHSAGCAENTPLAKRRPSLEADNVVRWGPRE